MRVLLTGAFGNVGFSTLNELIKKGHYVRVFELKNYRNKNIAKKYKNKAEIIWGDLRNFEQVEKAVEGMDAVIHLAAIIPPLADFKPELAKKINVGGTENIIKAIEKQQNKTKLVFSSSISVYGDRRNTPIIKVTDSFNPSPNDEYAVTKIKCEELIKKSSIEWAIIRLTYIVSPKKLNMDPLMFHMPIDTLIEICHTKDTGLAMVNAIESNDVWGKILNIAGGEKCRITYKQYLSRMLGIFGIGSNFLPDFAFSNAPFHCGFMDTDESQSLLHFQNLTLEDYFDEVNKIYSTKRFFAKIFKPIIQSYILNNSPYYKAYMKANKNTSKQKLLPAVVVKSLINITGSSDLRINQTN